MAITNSDGSIILSTQVDTRGIDRGMNSIKKSVTKIGSLMAAAFSVNLIKNFAKEAVNLASDLQEVQNVVDTAFGNMSYKIEEFSKTAIETFGLSELTAKRWASTMMAMGSGMGQALDVGSDAAIELTGRLADVMSFYNKTEEEAFTLGKAIYSGETEPLKSIGIIMTETNLELFAMEKGYQQLYKEMDAANKLLVRQQFFLEKTNLAAGDYVKTADGWANQTRTLTQRWKEMQTVFGETFMSIGVLVLPIIEAIIEGLRQIALAARVAAVGLGLIKEEAETTAKNATSQETMSSQTAENIENQVEAQKALNKETSKTLAGFDKVNKLSDNSASGGTSSASDTGFSLANGGGSSALSTAAEDISGKLMSIMAVAGVALMAIGLVLLTFGHIGWGLGFIIAGAASAGVAIATMRNGAIDQTVKDAMSNALIIAGIVAIVLGILICMAQHWALGIGLIILGASSIVSAVALNWDGIVRQLQSTFGAIMAIISGALIVIGIILVATGVGIPLGIGLILAGAAGLVTVAAANKNGIVKWIKDVWNNIKAFWNANIAPIFTAAFWLDLAKQCGNGLIGGFEAAINGIIGLFERMINFVVDALNLISIDVPDWVPAIGGKKFGFNLSNVDFGEVSIPRLAQGAVIPPNKEFLAVLGDQKNGTNIEAPLATIKQAVAEVLNGSGGGNIELTVLLDSDIIYKKVVQRNRQNTIRTGKNALAY